MSKFINSSLIEIQIVEWVWTLIPAILLLQIALPSLLLLYILDERSDSKLTVKTIGHQWYWSYQYRDLKFLEGIRLEFDSYIVPSTEILNSHFRLLDVDNRTVLPTLIQIRMLITSSDVLHSWTVPAMGVKADAVPGRLNQVKLVGHRPGLFFGQCSEICGANHRFMPIVVEMVRYDTFINWLIVAEYKKKDPSRLSRRAAVRTACRSASGTRRVAGCTKCRKTARVPWVRLWKSWVAHGRRQWTNLALHTAISTRFWPRRSKLHVCCGSANPCCHVLGGKSSRRR